MSDKLLEYAKGFVPLLIGTALLAVDKLLLNDQMPDEVWLTALGITAPVVAIPNKPQEERNTDTH